MRILADKFLDALAEAGVIRKDEHVRRVVIDAQVRSALVIYVERYGDERVLSVCQTLDGIEVKRGPAS